MDYPGAAKFRHRQRVSARGALAAGRSSVRVIRIDENRISLLFLNSLMAKKTTTGRKRRKRRTLGLRNIRPRQWGRDVGGHSSGLVGSEGAFGREGARRVPP